MDTVTVRSETSIGHSNTEVLSQEIDSQPTLRLRLKKPKCDKKVGWREGTVDNEHMNKKKSKCCCIYKKPVAFGESSSEDDEDCEHCFGHPEKRKKNRKHDHDHNHDDHDHNHDGESDDDGATCSIRKPTSIEPPQPATTIPPDS